MIKSIGKRFLSLLLSVLTVCTLLPTTAFAVTTLTTAVKDLSVSYTEGDTIEWSLEGGNIVGSVKATTGCSTAAATTTLTLTNQKTTDATLSFDYEVSITGGTITLDGTGVTTNNSFQKTVAPGGTVEIVLTSSATANQVTKITLKNILLYDPAATANVTFVPATEGGSYTVDGEAITAEVTKQNTADHGYVLAATPADGYRFYGWFSNGAMVSNNAATVMHLDTDQTITAIFVDKTLPTFSVEGTEFLDLNEAVTYAQNNSKDTIVLVGDGTLKAGSYIIPADITLLIPFDAKQTLYTTEPGYVKTAETQTAFRTLTLADGAALQVYGAISVGGKCYTSSSTAVCKPTGAYGHIKLAEGSTINVNSGANLYAWGYITGSGNVYVHSGANVYEFFQITDWRGGTATSNFKDNENKVFPFSQYYVQNVEAPMTFENGADETVRITVTAGGFSASAEVSFMGEEGMFQLAEGSTVTKRYDPATDRMIFDMNGSAKLNGIAMNNLPVIGSFNSNVYVLPINNNMTMNVHSGTMTLNQDTALLPGTKVIVDAGAELAVAEGMSLYVYDDAQWSTSYVWGSSGKGITQVAYSPSGKVSRTISDAVIDVNGTLVVNGAIYTTEGGADICSSQGTGIVKQNAIPGAAKVTYQASQTSSGDPVYYEIPITAAKLHNADGSYAETANTYSGAEINYVNGVWGIPQCTHEGTVVNDPAVEPTCTQPGKTAGTHCSACGKTLAAQEVIPAKGHSWDEGTVTTVPTCEEAGVKTFTCTVCNETKTEAIDATGHTPVDVAEQPATCTEAGMTAGTKCSVCGATISGLEEIPALGHTEEIRNVKEPTDTEDGYTGDTYCSVCDTLLNHGEVIPRTGVTVTWKNWDGTELATVTVTKNTVPVYSGETPVRAEDKHYTYTFTGWDPVPAEVTENTTYTAQFTAAGRSGLCQEEDGTYWLENGTHVLDKGLTQVKDAEGHNLYYYFGEDGKAVKNVPEGGQDFWISAEKANGLLPEWGYYFDENGVILHDEAFQNGIDAGYYYIDGIRVHKGMFKLGEDYYYAKRDGKLAVSETYYCQRNNGLLPDGYYTFDADGKITNPPQQDLKKNGIVEEDGSLFYYENGFRTYAGLIEIDGSFYYVRTNGEVVHGRSYWITKTNGLMSERSYQFADDGKMLDPEIKDESKNGIVEEDGSLYYYQDGLRTYAGLIEIDGSFYYVKTNGEVVHGRSYWISKTNGLMPERSYQFADDGKMLDPELKDTTKDGIVEEDGSLYYYVDGFRTYAGLIEIDGSFYYVRTSGELAHGQKYWITKTNGLMPEGPYTFADDGKMITE